MSPEAVALTVGILGVLGTLVAVLLKNHRSSPESRTADAQAWNLLNGGLQAEVARLTSVVAQQGNDLGDAKAAVVRLQEKVSRLHEVEGVLRHALKYIHTLIGILKELHHDVPEPPDGLDLIKPEDEEVQT